MYRRGRGLCRRGRGLCRKGRGQGSYSLDPRTSALHDLYFRYDRFSAFASSSLDYPRFPTSSSIPIALFSTSLIRSSFLLLFPVSLTSSSFLLPSCPSSSLYLVLLLFPFVEIALSPVHLLHRRAEGHVMGHGGIPRPVLGHLLARLGDVDLHTPVGSRLDPRGRGRRLLGHGEGCGTVLGTVLGTRGVWGTRGHLGSGGGVAPPSAAVSG